MAPRIVEGSRRGPEIANSLARQSITSEPVEVSDKRTSGASHGSGDSQPESHSHALLRRFRSSVHNEDCVQDFWFSEEELDDVVEHDRSSLVSGSVDHPVRAVSKAHHSHGHHKEHKPMLLTAVMSALINFLLMFGLCCAYGMIMFTDEWLEQHRGLAVKINLGTALIAGGFLAWLSDIPVAIGGPDLNPVVFLSTIASIIAEAVADDMNLGELGKEFCKEPSVACESYHTQLRATFLIAVATTSAIFAFIFFLMGWLRLTSYVSYVPTSVMEAFLSCVGYKVFSYALKFSLHDPAQFVPAAVVGVFMYFVKVTHIWHPAIALPLILLLPLVAFYVFVTVMYGGLNGARENGLMFPEIVDEPFYKLWSDGLLKANHVNVNAFVSTLPDMVTMVIVVVLDCLLKVSATENKLPVKYSKDNELLVDGLVNVVTTLCSASVGYMQLKFNVINYGVLGNVTDRRAGFIYAALIGVFFFWSADLINYMPRFFLSAMLYFAGAGFVAENLWGSRHFLSFAEWLHIVVIFGVFVFSGQLLWAVVTGCVITSVDFLFQYAKVSSIRGGVLSGSLFTTAERHDPLVHFHLDHVLDSWLLVVPLKGYIFFGSAQSVKMMLHEKLAAQLKLPGYQRVRFLLFDCELLDGLDASAAKAFRQLCLEATTLGATPLWGHVSPLLMKRLLKRSVVTLDSFCFPDMYEALRHVELRALEHLDEVQRRWHKVDSTFEEYHRLLRQQKDYEPFEGVFSKHVMAGVSRSNPWAFCSRQRLKQGGLLWRPGQAGVSLFVVHCGAVGIFQSPPPPGCPLGEPGNRPLTVYRHGWFLNIRAITRSRPQHWAFATEDCELLAIEEVNLYRMSREEPAMTAAITQAIVRQQLLEEQLHTQLRASREEELEPLSRLPSPERRASPDVRLEEVTHHHNHNRPKGFASLLTCDENVVAQVEEETAVHEQELPHVLSEQLRGLRTVQTLALFGLFEAEDAVGTDEAELQPELPPRLRAHLLTAFREHMPPGQEEAVLPEAAMRPALKYAGIFDVSLPGGPTAALTQSQFLSFGRELLMTSLTQRQQRAIRTVFERFDTDASAALDQSQVETLFREHLVPSMSVEEIDAIANAYSQGRKEGVRLGEFMAMMSRFLRAYELDNRLLGSLLALEEPEKAGFVTAKTIALRSDGTLTQEDAEEMLWVADWHTGGAKDGKHLGLDGMLAAVLLVVDADDRGGYDSPMSRVNVEPASFREPEGRCLRALDALLNQPKSSKAARLSNFVLGLAIATFLSLLVLEPLLSGHPANSTHEKRGWWWIAELGFGVFFTIELMLRLLIAASCGREALFSFLKNSLTVCDFVAVLPSYIDLFADGWHVELGLLRCARLLFLMRFSHFEHVFHHSLCFPATTVLIVIWGIYLANPPKKY